MACCCRRWCAQDIGAKEIQKSLTCERKTFRVVPLGYENRNLVGLNTLSMSSGVAPLPVNEATGRSLQLQAHIGHWLSKAVV